MSSDLMKRPPAGPDFPSHIADFEIVRRLGAGGMAEVFVAKKRGAEGTFKVVVLKRILPAFTTSQRFRSMFIDEAQLATRLNHPNVVQVYEFASEGNDGHFLAMEYIEGCDLGQFMSTAKSKGRLIPPWVLAFIIAEVAKGLHYAHEKRDEGGAPLDIVHRDVSPQNVLISFEGVVKIADFGIASARLSSEEEGVLKGKFGYMAPEQARGERVDRRSDLYALGVIFWEGLTGLSLHGSLSGEALLEVVRSGTSEPPSKHVRDIPSELEGIVMKLLAPLPSDRYATGRDVAAAIGRLMLQKQMFADASMLEATLASLVPRDGIATPLTNPPLEHHTQAAVPHALSGGQENLPRSPSLLPPGSAPPRKSEAREVRHVAIVTLRLLEPPPVDGESPHSEESRKALLRALERSRGMFGDMAYKRGMRWVWTGDLEARAIAGLGPRPSKAASDAAWIAVETHEALEAIKEDLPAPVFASLSIVRGIASGTRDPEGNLVRYVLHEPATYLADVLARATPAKATWVAGGVYRLARRAFRWQDAPTLDLKADAAPVQHLPPVMRIYALERSVSREEKSDHENAHGELVGRDREKAELLRAYHVALSGSGIVSCRAVVGELGIGKTALVSTFIEELPPSARVVRVECTPVRMEIPYSALADLVRGAIGANGDESYDDIARLISSVGGGSGSADVSNPVVARLVEIATNQASSSGKAGHELGLADDEYAHFRKRVLISGVRQLVAAIALTQPLVLIVEGLQWADKPTLELVTEVLKAPDPLPVLLVLVTRPDDRVGSLLEGRERIDLHPLSTEDQVRLVETRLSVREGVQSVCDELMPRVGGNPFYLLEMIDALLERGVLEIREDALVRSHTADLDTMGLPSTLEQLLADRIQELPGPEHVIVDWLAIAGGPLGLADLVKLNARVAKRRDASVDDSVDRSLVVRASEHAIVRLCARGLCDQRGDVLDFRHALTRDVAYASLDPTTRSRMHRTLGEHLAETSLARGLEAAIVARHLVRGDATQLAAQFYLEAANAARNAYQTQLSIRYYSRAAEHFAEGDPRMLTVQEALESIFRDLGRRRDRVRHLEALRKAAKSVGTARAVCLALLRTARYDLDEGHLAHGLPVAKRASEIARGASSFHFEIEAELLVSELSRELGDVQGALAASDRALAACNPNVNATVPSRVRAEVLRTRGILLRRVGRVREAVDTYLEAIGVFRKVGARRQEARAKSALAYAIFVQGRYEDAIALGLESIRIDLSIGGRFQLAKTLATIGHAYARLGDMPRAEIYLRRAREAHERYGDPYGRAETLLVSAEVLLERGDYDTAKAYLVDATQTTEHTGNAYDKTHAALVMAALARYRRDARTAIQYALAARRNAEQQALVSFQFCAFAIEASARVDVGEMHAATLLATTALGAVEALQGCEYGLEVRVLCADALKRAGSPQAPAARQKAVDYAAALMATIGDPRLKRCFLQRPLVTALFDSTPMPHAVAAEDDG